MTLTSITNGIDVMHNDGSSPHKKITTSAQIRALKPAAATYEHSVASCKGLRIRVYPSGRKSWFYRYRNPHTKALELMKLGEFGERNAEKNTFGLSDAADKVARERQIVREHDSAKRYRDDQKKARRKARADQDADSHKAGYTVEKMLAAYIDSVSNSLKSWRAIQRSFNRHVLPAIGPLPVHEVTKADIRAMLQPLRDKGKDTMANRVRSYTCVAFNWEIDKEEPGGIETNPCDRVKNTREKPRQRKLSDIEIKRFAEQLPKSGLTEAQRDYLLFLLLTGARPGEAARIAAADVDLETCTAIERDTKNGLDFTLQLSPTVVEIANRRITDSPWLFPSDGASSTPLSRCSPPLARAFKDGGFSNLEPFRPHDLRRSFASGLARIGAPMEIVGRALNHKPKGVTAEHYATYDYAKEIREWCEKWDAHVKALVKGSATITRLAS